MRIFHSILFLLAAGLFVPQPVVQAQSSLREGLPSDRMLNRYGLERAWWSQAVMNPSRDKVSHMTLDEELLYVHSSSNIVTAFNNITGEKVWSLQLGRRDAPSFPPVSNQDTVLVASGMELFAIEKATGKQIWKLRLPAAPSTSPAMDKKYVYIGASDGSMYAFSLSKIHELYSERLLPQWSYQTQLWRYKTGKEISTPAVTTGRTVLFASLDGSLYSVTSERREPIFQLEMDSPVAATLSDSGGYIYMASQDFNFYCVNMENGGIRWEFVTGLPIQKPAKVIGEHCFLTPHNGGMYCLTSDTGQRVWWRPRISEFLSASNTVVYASDEVGNVVMLNRANGGIIGSLPLRHFKTRLSNDRNDRLYMCTLSGLIVCISEKDREFPLYHKYPERRPIMPGFAPEGGDPPEQPAVDNGGAPVDNGGAAVNP